MTSKGSPYARFRRALAAGNLAMVRTAAAEFPQVDLGDALEICVLMARAEPDRYERAALRWLARFSLQSRVTLAQVALAVAALEAMPADEETALAQLRALAG
jgi:hypothetical protein